MYQISFDLKESDEATNETKALFDRFGNKFYSALGHTSSTDHVIAPEFRYVFFALDEFLGEKKRWKKKRQMMTNQDLIGWLWQKMMWKSDQLEIVNRLNNDSVLGTRLASRKLFFSEYLKPNTSHSGGQHAADCESSWFGIGFSFLMLSNFDELVRSSTQSKMFFVLSHLNHNVMETDDPNRNRSLMLHLLFKRNSHRLHFGKSLPGTRAKQRKKAKRRKKRSGRETEKNWKKIRSNDEKLNRVIYDLFTNPHLI